MARERYRRSPRLLNGRPHGRSAPSGKATLVLTFDLDKLAIGAGVAGLSSPLRQLLSAAPAGTEGALDWLPDLSLSEAETLLSLESGNLGAYVVVADADGNALASTLVFVAPAGDSRAPPSG